MIDGRKAKVAKELAELKKNYETDQKAWNEDKKALEDREDDEVLENKDGQDSQDPKQNPADMTAFVSAKSSSANGELYSIGF
ncbi:uncharacterized protein HKW66_Vig0248240 [Vigna angularis]|uniref:Uncharacterized protein n=1 Tax=Phaseolus angularis TaxID=3914 RepID=A0A8T0KSE3_PHAAN|nr:uncharacterized protein HKW66_Vig0248240 [Vigna angularis]